MASSLKGIYLWSPPQAATNLKEGHTIWLFAGNDRAGGTAALLYSLIASAERHALDPQRYLTSILARLPGLPPSDLPKLLPDAWKRADVDVTSATATATS